MSLIEPVPLDNRRVLIDGAERPRTAESIRPLTCSTGRVLMIAHVPWRTDLEPPPAPPDEELQSI
jgi:hypothetical protein